FGRWLRRDQRGHRCQRRASAQAHYDPYQEHKGRRRCRTYRERYRTLRRKPNTMRALIQRAKDASVTIDGAVHGSISHGLLILLGVCEGDTEAEADYLADKCVGLRIFTDENDKMNLSCADVGGGLLVVSQFT